MSRRYRFAVLADLHLSDRGDTAAAAALEWAASWLCDHPVDFLAVAGDVTTYGSGPAMARVLDACAGLPCPVYHTPGNAERRGVDALALLRPHLAPERRVAVHGDLLVLLPDTSTGRLPRDERSRLEEMVGERGDAARRVVITHCPLDKLKAEDAAWMAAWMELNGVELLVAGHSHLQRRRELGNGVEVVVPGLDPDKAIGDLPGLTVLESAESGVWREELVPWSPSMELMPSDLPGGQNPVGWSIHGDPAAAARETLDQGLSCLELRPRGRDLRLKPAPALSELRQRGPLFLSHHLPNLTWDPERGRIDGEGYFREHVEHALAAGVDSLTVHVPRALSRDMLAHRGGYRPEEPTALYRVFAELTARLLAPAAGEGVRIAIENLHNPHATPVGSPGQIFGATIEQVRRWVETMRAALPEARVGAHLDVGHARNNGGQLDNLQPLGDWNAALGRDILGYHIHQVRPDPETGRPANHRGLDTLFGPRISYAGFLWAWSTHQITRGPLFVEVRDDAERRATASLLQDLFGRADQIERSADLPGRAGYGRQSPKTLD